jgi:hypothetical protein
MKLPRYEINAEESLMVYRFISEGKKGNIVKIIKYTKTNIESIYNLAFGDINIEDGSINDTVITDNGDSEKVLATVVSTVFAFTSKYPKYWVFATGSTNARTRLYRMGISKYISEVEHEFEIYGLLDGEWTYFKPDYNFSSFLIRRKQNEHKKA